MKQMDDETYKLISDLVVEECGRRGICGVFAMAEVEFPSRSRSTWALLDRASWGKKMNLLALATSKLNAMLSTRTIRSRQIHLKYVAEITYQGKDGHRSQDGNFCYAFSGATEEVNEEIERLACEFHESLK